MARSCGAGSPGRPSRIPEAVTEALPKTVWVLRSREPARLERILLDGPLLDAANISYAAVLAPALTAALIHAVGGDNPDKHDPADLLADAADAAELLPAAADRAQLASGSINSVPLS